MSKGSPVITVRVPQEVIDRIERHLERINLRRKEEPYTLRTFISQAIADKIDHVERSLESARKKKIREGKKDAAFEEWVDEVIAASSPSEERRD